MYTMKQVCHETNMSYETLKFYCNKGLVPNVKRSENNHRVFDDHDLAWIKSLVCLKNCQMSLADMTRYLEMCLAGPKSIPQRKIMLDKKRKDLCDTIEQLEASVKYIDWKQNFYDEVMSGKRKYISSLTK